MLVLQKIIIYLFHVVGCQRKIIGKLTNNFAEIFEKASVTLDNRSHFSDLGPISGDAEITGVEIASQKKERYGKRKL